MQLVFERVARHGLGAFEGLGVRRIFLQPVIMQLARDVGERR